MSAAAGGNWRRAGYWNDHEHFYPKVAGWLGLAPANPPAMQTKKMTLVTMIERLPAARRSLEAFFKVPAEE